MLPEVVYRTVRVLSAVVTPAPRGTRRGLLECAWMVVSGGLLASRGAILPALSACGLTPAQARRAWAAVRSGAWTTGELVGHWRHLVEQAGRWQARCHGGYQPVAADLTQFPRPRLTTAGQRQYVPSAHQRVPVIPVGLVAAVGQVGAQRLALPRAFVPADPAAADHPSHLRALVRATVAGLGPTEVALFDRGVPLSLIQAAGCPRYVVRLLKNCTARRATRPAYGGRGRRATRGPLVRPLARTRQGRTYPATPPDRSETWTDGDHTLRADWWHDLVLPEADPDGPRFHVVAIYDPRSAEPLLLATPLAVPAATAQALYADRWPIEHLPLVSKQLLGAHRQFVHAPAMCQRWPEWTLLLGSVLSYLAATHPPMPTGFWDRRPQPTPGRFRRMRAAQPWPTALPWPAAFRPKASVTAHLPKGIAAHRRRPRGPGLARAA